MTNGQVAPGGAIKVAHDSTTLCAVCRCPCVLESCVVDEAGRAVHASGYQSRVSSTPSVRSKYDETEDLLQQAKELRDVADQLIQKSDRLIEAYKQLTGQAKRPRTESN